MMPLDSCKRQMAVGGGDNRTLISRLLSNIMALVACIFRVISLEIDQNHMHFRFLTPGHIKAGSESTVS